MRRKLSVFIHLPKCGGTSVDANLRHHFGDRFFQYVNKKDDIALRKHQQSKFEGIDVVSVHNGLFNYGKAFLNVDVTYYAVCREPISAAVSMYNFATTAKHTRNYERVKDLEFWQFVAFSHKIPIWAPNFQSYYLCGARRWDAVQARLEGLNIDTAPLSDLNEIYAKMTGRDMQPDLNRNKSEKRIRVSDLSAREIDILTELFDVDMQLWNAVQRL